MRHAPWFFHVRRLAGSVVGWLAPLALGLAIGLSTTQPILTFVILGGVVALLFLGIPRNEPVVVVAFAALTMPRLQVPGSPLPLNEVLMLGSVVISLLHPRGVLARAPRWFSVLLWTMFGVFVFSTVFNQLFVFAANKRLAHLLVFVAVAVGLARGRIPRGAALDGLVIGLGVSASTGIVSYLTGIGATSYAGRLTGMFGDPNLAGLQLAVLGPLAAMHIETPRNRRVFLALLVVAVVLSFSRTSLLAMVMVGMWLAVGRRLRAGAGTVLLVGLIASIGFIPTSVQSIGPFNDRSGSDELRVRIVESELTSVREAPLIGHGAGTATVVVNEGTTRMFFHNSYLALAQEAGFVSLAAYVVVLVATFLSLIRLRDVDRNPWMEASLIALAVCALNLGEVLLDLTAAVSLGVAMSQVVRARAGTTVRAALVRVP